MVGQKSLANEIMMNETEVTLKVDVISNICWKEQLFQQELIK